MKILLAIDDSRFSELALDACCEFINAGMVESVKIVSVYEPQTPIAAEPVMISGSYYEALNTINADRTETVVQRAVVQLRLGAPDADVEVTTAVELGQPAAHVLEHARRWAADMKLSVHTGEAFGDGSRLVRCRTPSFITHRALYWSLVRVL